MFNFKICRRYQIIFYDLLDIEIRFESSGFLHHQDFLLLVSDYYSVRYSVSVLLTIMACLAPMACTRRRVSLLLSFDRYHSMRSV